MSHGPVGNHEGRRGFFRTLALAVGGTAVGMAAAAPTTTRPQPAHREAPLAGAFRKHLAPAAVPSVRA